MPKNKTAQEDICQTIYNILKDIIQCFLDTTMKYNARISRTKNSWVIDAANTDQKQI